jgi:hypothetical protein
MLLSVTQVVAAVLLISYAVLWHRQQTKRHRKNWHEIVNQLQGNDWGIEEVTENYLYKGGILATTEDIWTRIEGCHGLMAMYKNAPVLVQLADYAAEHGQGVNQEMLENLRSDAFQIRLCVMLALAQHIMSASSAGAAVNAYRATTTYSEMLASLTAFIQEYSANLFPSYLDAVA